MNRVLLVVVSLCSLGLVCGPAGPPSPDSCGSPETRMVGTLEIGPEIVHGQTFSPWTADDTAYISEGVQGGYMLGVALRLPAGAPACVKQTTTVSAGGSVLATEDAALNTYEATDGTRTTRTTWLVFDDTGPAIGSQVTVKTVAAGHTITSNLTIALDRHRVESLTLLTASPKVGSPITLELTARLAPAGSIEPSYGYSNPGIVDVLPPPYIYGGTQTISGTAVSAGQTDFIVTFRDQELRVPITVAP